MWTSPSRGPGPSRSPSGPTPSTSRWCLSPSPCTDSRALSALRLPSPSEPPEGDRAAVTHLRRCSRIAVLGAAAVLVLTVLSAGPAWAHVTVHPEGELDVAAAGQPAAPDGRRATRP